MNRPNPFRYFKTSPEISRLAVMMYVRFPLPLRNVEAVIPGDKMVSGIGQLS